MISIISLISLIPLIRVFTIAHAPVRVIILILSAFFWLLSLLLSSLLWFAVVPLKTTLAFGLVFSVVFQEIFRILIYLLLRKADAFMKKLTENEQTQIFANRHILSYVVGLGFGLMSGVFSLVNVLADSLGPGTVGFYEESHATKDFFMISAVLCLCMVFCNTFWGVLAFDALDKICADRSAPGQPFLKSWITLGFVWLSHLTVSSLTLLNQSPTFWTYIGTMIPIGFCTIFTIIWAFIAAGGTKSALLSCLLSGRSSARTVEVPVPTNN